MAMVCPWWVGYLLLNPLRRVAQSPRRTLSPLVREGMTILEVGPGMGFFTLDLARMVGPDGRVVAVDVEPRMVDALSRRLRRAALGDRAEVRLSRAERLDADDLEGRVDLALLIYVVHEVEDPARLFETIRRTLAPQGRALIVEPPLHVSRAAFSRTLETARLAGLHEIDRPRWRGCKTALLRRGSPPAPESEAAGGRAS